MGERYQKWEGEVLKSHKDGNGKVLKRNIKNIAIVYTKFDNIVLKIN